MKASEPPIVSVIACGMPLYGHLDHVELAHGLQHRERDLRARRAVAGGQLARLLSDLRQELLQSFAGKSGRTISMNEVVPRRAIGAKSFTGS